MAVLIVVDILVVVVLSVLVGAIAPRVPALWLSTDTGPLLLNRAESASGYRRLGVPVLARRLPELGGLFGGESKASLTGYSADGLIAYAVEVRRAEWVHWMSIAAAFVLFAFNPWWLAALFVILVAIGNAPFILVLRNNRVRIRGILERDGRRQ
ncbi:MAG: hypothetical protein PSX37_01555 [bacterium]|nr:hypothetical protein [bacterium]